MSGSAEKVVIQRVRTVKYRGMREAAEKLGVTYSALYTYMYYGKGAIGADKRARLAVQIETGAILPSWAVLPLGKTDRK